MAQRTCLQCGVDISHRSPRAEHCSKNCGRKTARATNARRCTTDDCGRPHAARGLCLKHWKQQHGPRRTTYPIVCQACGETAQSSRPDGKFCNDTCKGVFYSDTMRKTCKLPAHHPVMMLTAEAKRLQQIEREARARRRPEARECPGCACWFSPLSWRPMITCSRRCKRRMSSRRRRAREHGARGSWVWSDFMRVAAKFNYCCAYCGERRPLEPDHVVPLSRGGYDSVTNLLPSCSPCNGDKSALLLDEWALARERRCKPPVATNWAPEDRRYHHLTQCLLTRAA